MNINIGKRRCNAQTFIEYILLFGIVTGLIVAMSPMIRRFTQGMVKLTADQIGDQRRSDQKGGEGGYLVNAYVKSDGTGYEGREDHFGVITYYPRGRFQRETTQFSNLGITRP